MIGYATKSLVVSGCGLIGGFPFVMLLSTLALTQGSGLRAEETRRPNIIFILTDDQRADTLSCTGNKIVHTPNIDRLAHEGVLFTNAYVTSAICTPSRATFLTGTYERRHGVNFNSGTALSEEAWQNSYPVVLKNNGYFTGYIGKNHTPVGPTGYASHIMDKSFDYWYASHKHLLFYPKEKPPGMTVTPGYDDVMFRNARANTQVEVLSEGVMNFLQPEDRFYREAVAFLGKRKPDQPFCLSVCFNLPHDAGTGTMQLRPTDPELYRTGYRDQKDVITADLPATYCAKQDIKTPKLPETVLHARNRQGQYNYVDQKDTMVERITRRYETIEGIDRFVGKLVETLKELKLSDDTVLIFASDHGIMRGEFGLGGKALNYEPCLRIPMLIYHPWLAKRPGGVVCGKLVQSIDVAPTILDMAGIRPPECMQGRSMLPLLKDTDHPWRAYAFAENLWSNRFGNPRIESVRGEDGWKYIRYFKNDESLYDRSLNGKLQGLVSNAEAQRYKENLYASIRGEKPVYEELFNLNDDPNEVNSRAADPGCAEIIARYRAKCQELVTQARGDDRLLVDELMGERREAFEHARETK